MLLVSNGICTDTILQQVIVQNFSINAGADSTVCAGTVVLTATGTGGVNYYVWSHNHNFTDTLNINTSTNTATITLNTSGWYYIYGSTQICNGMDSVYLTVSVVNIQAGNNVTICQGNSINLSVTNLNPINPLTYSWSPLASIISGATTPNPLVDPLVTTMFYVVATDSLGCQIMDSVLVTVSAITDNPTITNVSCNGICDGQLSLTPTGGISPYYYLWNTGATTSNISSLCSGTYTVTVHDDFGCQKIYTYYVAQPAPIVLSILDTQNVFCNGICNGSATIGSSGGTTPYIYNWSNGQTTQTASNLCAGTYLVTVTDNHGCSNSMQVMVTDTSDMMVVVDSLVQPTCFNSCDGEAYTFTSGGTFPYTYLWNNGVTASFDTTLCAGVNYVTVTESMGCIRNIYFNLNGPTAVQSSLSNIQMPTCFGYCDGQATAAGSGGNPPYSYQWSNLQSGASVTNLCEGTYYVSVTDDHNCLKVDTITLTQPPLLTGITIASNVPCIEVCDGIATVTPSGGTPPYSYLWSDGQSTNPAINLCEGTYTVTISDQNNCHFYDTIAVHDSTTFPPFVNTYADDDTIYHSQNTGIHTTHIPGDSYSWSPTTGLDNPASPDPVASPETTTTYIVTFIDAFGCTITDTITIYVIDVLCDENDIFVPNAFTPNGDNNNDVLYVRSHVLSKFYFTIYDRWGEKVFETTDINKGWDGTFRGKLCDPGVFDYYLEITCIDDQKNIKKGNITLIR